VTLKYYYCFTKLINHLLKQAMIVHQWQQTKQALNSLNPKYFRFNNMLLILVNNSLTKFKL